MARGKKPTLDMERINRTLDAAKQLAAIQKSANRMRRMAPRHFLPLSKAYWEARAVKRNWSKLSKESFNDAKIRFLKDNEAIAAKILAAQPVRKRARKAGAKWARQFFNETLKRSDTAALNEWVVETMRIIEGMEIKKLRPTMTEYLKKYLESKGRQVKTRIEKQALDRTVASFLKGKLGKDPARMLNLSAIRFIYFLHRINLKRGERQKARYLNSLFQEIFGKEGFTRNQRRSTMQWLEEHYERLEAEEERIMERNLPQDEKAATNEQLERLSQKFDKAEQRFEARARKEVLAMFREPEKETGARPETTRPVGGKGGGRAERIVAYEKAQRLAMQATVEKAGEDKALKKARPAAKKFDAVEFVLGEIAKRNQKTATFLRRLHEKDLITESSLRKLYARKELTLRLFRTVVNDRAFKAKFGNEQIEVLARGLGFIGPAGKRPESVRKEFKGPRGGEVFEFLERKGYFETVHSAGKGKGLVIYIKRL